jgi:hypothetical protein
VSDNLDVQMLILAADWKKMSNGKKEENVGERYI